VTYCARGLEPYRGFHVFMRSLPLVQRQRPNAHIVLIGGDRASYGRDPQGHGSYREQLLTELGAELDLPRVHFLGNVPYAHYRRILQVSSVHVYLTYPWVLSWSFIEAMAMGCLVIGSNTPPVEEVITDGKNGFLVDFRKNVTCSVCQAIRALGLILAKSSDGCASLRRPWKEVAGASPPTPGTPLIALAKSLLQP
jgi:glycosyltransferase involved in cell wall biosynthesis